MFVLDHLWKLAQAQLGRRAHGTNYAAFGRCLNEMLTPPNPGFYVAHSSSPCRRGRAGLAMAIEHARSHDRVVACWLNPRDGEFYFESVQALATREEAFNAAMKNRQSGIYDLAQQSYVDLTDEPSDHSLGIQAVSA